MFAYKLLIIKRIRVNIKLNFMDSFYDSVFDLL